MSDLEQLIRQIVREEIANANHSRTGSPIGIGVRDHGDPECERKETEHMDPTNTETSGESSSSEPTASELLQRMRAKRERVNASLKSTKRRVSGR